MSRLRSGISVLKVLFDLWILESVKRFFSQKPLGHCLDTALRLWQPEGSHHSASGRIGGPPPVEVPGAG